MSIASINSASENLSSDKSVIESVGFSRNAEAKSEILNRLKESKAKNPHIPSPNPHYQGTMKLNSAILEEFITNHTNNKSIIIQTPLSKIEEEINKILSEEQSKKVLYNTDINADISKIKGAELIAYTDNIESRRAEFFGVDTSIVQARCGIANVGVVGLSANPNAPRLSSLITNTCIYLLEKENVVEHLFAGIELIKAYERKTRNSEILPSNIIFVAGPSRTADIELQTVFGVHGPRKTYVILY